MKAFLIIISVIFLAVFIKFKTSHDYTKSKAAIEYRRMYNQHLMDLYGQQNAEIQSILWLDSIFSQNAEYSRLKQFEYNLYMQRGNFNTSSKEATEGVFKCLNVNKYSPSDRAFIFDIFKLSIMFRILDELNNPNMPTKKQLCIDFGFMVKE